MQYAPNEPRRYELSRPNATEDVFYSVRGGVLIYALLRILLVQGPLKWIVGDVLANAT
jgi:hypothetical protein